MPVFAQRMKDFTDHLQSSIENRADALEQVHQSTNQLLDAARTFVAGVTHEHHEMAGELHASLTQFHDDLSDRVEGMRKHHRDSLDQTRADLRQRLDENQATRNQTVKTMRHAFADARRQVADDLHGARDEWQTFAATRRAKG
jgi:DNA anti-recombination protein RmuC